MTGGSWAAFCEWVGRQLAEYLTTPKGGKSISMTLGSGYNVEAERERRAQRLKNLCDFAVSNPAWMPKDGRTYCNKSLHYIAQGCGYFSFPFDSLANSMIAHMENVAGWRLESDIGRVADLAKRGALIVLGLKDEPHGHVAVAYPSDPQMSGSWGRPVCMIANVGKKNGVMRLSEAFRVEDQFNLKAFILEASEV